MSITKEQIAAHLKVVQAVAEAIREAGTIPSGHLYSALCGKMDLNSYNRIIDMLKRTELVSETNHVLKWEGPKS